MNHAELSRDLALAIGYAPESVKTYAGIFGFEGGCEVYRVANHWREFDYRAPDVALAMVELALEDGEFFAYGSIGYWYQEGKKFGKPQNPPMQVYKTLPEAAARAVIALKGMK